MWNALTANLLPNTPQTPVSDRVFAIGRLTPDQMKRHMKEILEQSGREVNIGALHSVLKRLESKGYLKSEMGGATAERGGRRKRYFIVTKAGTKLSEEMILQKLQLYQRVLGTTIKIS